MSDLKVAVSPGSPECPNCGCDGFDDWHNSPTIKRGIGLASLQGSLRCHSCGRFFRVTKYHDGAVHTCMGGFKRKSA